MSQNLLFILLVLCLIFSCNKNGDTPKPHTSILSKIKIADGNLVDANNHAFFPWGLNYTNPEGVGLIEDNWQDNTVWETIQSDFSEMKDIGANVIRTHLQYNKFMSDANTPNQTALNRLEDLVDLAASNGLYLDITGLGAYRKSDQPDFYENMTDEERWNTQAVFWETIADKVGSHPAVFAFNLMNEPVVSVNCDSPNDCDWLPGDSFGGFHFVQNITKTSGLEFASTLRDWIAKMTQSIRTRDNNTLITVGFLALGNYSQFSADLDYISPHIYPKSGEIDMAINNIMSNQSSVPLVIEETSNLNCNIMELEQFLMGIDGSYDGLMGHYHGIPIKDLDENDIPQAIQKNFLQFFKKNNPTKLLTCKAF